MGAQLTVRPGQQAIFVNEGKIADIFNPGMHTLTTKNLPVLSTLQGWKYGFDSPFKAEVYFVSTRQVTDLKWGTPNPVMLRDPDFGPIRLRAFGNYALQATDPRALLTELVGTDGTFEADEISELLRSMINTAFAEIIGSSKIAALDLAASYKDLSDQLRRSVVERVDDEYGLDVPALQIVNISFPEEVEKALDKRTSMGVIGDLGRYQQYQLANAMTTAAANPGGGGGAAEGMGLGMGYMMAQQMARGMAAPPMAAQSPPPPPAASAAWFVAEQGRSVGPMELSQLMSWLSTGRLQPATPVWTHGLPNWLPAQEVPQLAGAFPPPPPPPRA
jgi:membrane protease subunit (stomatin/prohibitin family)